MKLNKTQRRLLESARRGGVFYMTIDRKYPALARLIMLGLITRRRDRHGRYNITPAGRAALTHEGER